MAMDPELKAKWTAALRSGEFKQGEGYLRKGDGYCCLGVLATIFGMEAIENKYDNNVYEFAGRSHYLPSDFSEGIGLPREQQNALAFMNDGFNNTGVRDPDEKRDFAAIADWIDANL